MPNSDRDLFFTTVFQLIQTDVSLPVFTHAPKEATGGALPPLLQPPPPPPPLQPLHLLQMFSFFTPETISTQRPWRHRLLLTPRLMP
jgi:hypothetical protein